ncbi:unnamed protein product [Closterium sp. NIES-64]|nr:unnamed protein product [Closterium sp. NIES-64]
MTTCPTRLTSPSTSANHVRAANSTERPSTLSVPLTKLARRERHARGSRELHLAATTSRSSRSGSRSSVATPTAPTSVPLTQLLGREGLTPASLGLHVAPQVEAGAGLAAGRQAARQAKRQAGRQAGDAQRASRARAHQWAARQQLQLSSSATRRLGGRAARLLGGSGAGRLGGGAARLLQVSGSAAAVGDEGGGEAGEATHLPPSATGDGKRGGGWWGAGRCSGGASRCSCGSGRRGRQEPSGEDGGAVRKGRRGRHEGTARPSGGDRAATGAGGGAA